MRFPTIFRRRVGEPPDPFRLGYRPEVDDLWFERKFDKLIPELGSDKIPETTGSRRDNLHESRLVNVNGFPSQRICVGYQGPPQAPALLAEMYLFDETSSSWFRVPPCTPFGDSEARLLPGVLAYFDPPCLLDHSRAKKNSEDESHQSGSLEVLLIVRAETADGRRCVDPDDEPGIMEIPFPKGVYTFVIGTDVSNPG